MVRVICIRHSTTAGFKLTKLFGIYDFSVEKDSGKVLIIIIYCFYNYCSPQGFGPEAKTRGGTLGFPGCIHTRTKSVKYKGMCL